MFSEQKNIIGHRLEKNPNVINVYSIEDKTWFNFKSINELFRRKEDTLFKGLEEENYFDIEFEIYEEDGFYYWDLAVYNNYDDEKLSIELIRNLNIFLSEISSLKNYKGNYSFENWTGEDEGYVEIIKGEKILELKEGLSWDDIIREIDTKLIKIEERCINLLKII